VIGAGGLGCPALLTLGAEVPLTLVDPDRVDMSNLQRQILHRTEDVGRLKVDSAEDALRRRWPGVDIHKVPGRIGEGNARQLIAGHDVVLDGTDSFPTKFLLNDVCLELGVPLVHGGVVGWTGQLMTVLRGHACFRCIFEAAPTPGSESSCQTAGVLGAVCGVIGGLMAEEALAILDGRPALAGTLMVFEARTDTWRRISPRPRASCPAHPASEVATW
jgi:molybdopterin-synthase adenylyltransferase